MNLVSLPLNVEKEPRKKVYIYNYLNRWSQLQWSSQLMEGHNQIGEGKRYHNHVRGMFNIINDTHPYVDDSCKLRIATCSINDTMVPEGMVPSILVFEVLPSFPALSSFNKNQLERYNALALGRAKLESMFAQNRIEIDLWSKRPQAKKLYSSRIKAIARK